MRTKNSTGRHRPDLIRRVAGWTVADILSRHGKAADGTAHRHGRCRP
ncbi:MAG: hypothetical protein ACRDMV_04870 [Streptosporangiales bacterium]